VFLRWRQENARQRYVAVRWDSRLIDRDMCL
jgi:hypothetical protein